MALRDIVIRMNADSTGFSQGIARAAQSGNQFYRQMESAERRSAVAARETQRALQGLTNEFSSIKAAAGGMGVAVAGAFATSALIQSADSWTNLSSRVKLASTDSIAAATNMRMLMDISQRTGTSIEANASLFSRIAASMRTMGYNAQATGKLTEMLATSLRLSGANAGEASSVITQFSQAMASGVLRGEEFNSIMENGSRFATALADGLNVTKGQLRAMANEGQLTTTRIMPALMSQFQKVKEEGLQMGATVAASSERVKNAFLQWVGAANNGYGATSLLSGALDGLATNISGVANATAVLVGLGVARYFGGIVTSTTAAAGGVMRAAAAETSLAAAQLNAARTAEAAARQTASRAAMARLAATSLEAQLVAEIKLRAAQANVAAASLSTAAAAARVTETAGGLSRIGSGLLSIIGGWPGLILASGAAMFALYQHTQASHKEALAFADSMAAAAKGISQLDAESANKLAAKTETTLAALKSEIATTDAGIRKVKDSLAGLQQVRDRANGGYSLSDFMGQEDIGKKQKELVNDLNDLIKTRRDLTDKAAQSEAVLASATAQHDEQVRAASVGVLQLVGSQEQLNQTAAQNRDAMVNAAQGVIMLTGAYRQLDAAAGKVTLKTPVSPVVNTTGFTPAQQKAFQQMQDTLNNSSLSGGAKAHAIAEQRARDLAFEGAAFTKYVAMQDEAYKNEQAQQESKKATTSATREHTAALKASESATRDYEEKMRRVTDAIEVQKVRLTEGKNAADVLAASQAGNVKWSKEEIAAYQAKTVALEKATQAAEEHEQKLRSQAEASKQLSNALKQANADLVAQANAGVPMTDNQRQEANQKAQAQATYDQTGKGPQDAETLNKTLDAITQKFAMMQQQRQDVVGGMQQGLIDYVDSISNYADQASQGVKSVMDGALDNVTNMLEGQKADWKSWGVSILKTIEQVALKMAVVQGLKALGGAFGVTMSADGNVFSGGTGLSAYSNSVVTRPTAFAFANGGVPGQKLGIMGEAGAEAILPLARDGASGKLGVRASGTGGSNIVVNSVVNVNGGNNSGGSDGAALGKAYQEAVDSSVKEGIQRESQPGGIIWKAQQRR